MPGPPPLVASLPSTAVPQFADVAVPRRLHRTFTYRVPDHLGHRVHIGSVVRIPFGSATLSGIVVAVSPTPPRLLSTSGPTAKRFRDILALDDGEDSSGIDLTLLRLARWMSEHYLAPVGQCARLMMPPHDHREARTSYRMTDEGRAAMKAGVDMSSTCREVARRLAPRRKGLRLMTLRRSVTGSLGSALREMTTRRWIEECGPQAASGDPAGGAPATVGRGKTTGLARPTAAREAATAETVPGGSWADRVQSVLRGDVWTPILLHAPHQARAAHLREAIQAVVVCGRTALVVTGEIDRALALYQDLAARWGDRVQALHGRMPAAARAEVWHRLRQGGADIVVGTRSAVFVPLPKLGLIAVEDEEASSLKDEQAPRYHAREVAWFRARDHRAVLLLGSAHPALETLTAVRAQGIVLSSGPAPSQAPAVELVDLRRVPFGTSLSERMIEGIGSALASGAGVVLYHNRKGFAPMLTCRDCGGAPRCRHCRVTVTYYRETARLRCHSCGDTAPVPERCPDCLGARLEPFGLGTEGLEVEVRRRFPAARLARLDRASLHGSAVLKVLRDKIRAGAIDIVIGTQLVFRGEAIPQVGFVGVPFADLGLHLPDFRAAEKTYRALLDAVGLARGADAGGRVVLQTSLPAHPVMAALASGDASHFYDAELSVREALDYPPFGTLISLHVSGRDGGAVDAASQAWAESLRAASGSGPRAGHLPTGAAGGTLGGVTIAGPITAPPRRRGGQHRSQLLVRGRDGDAMRRAVRLTVEQMERRREWREVRFEVDVDPVEF